MSWFQRGGILSGPEIVKQVEKGNIQIAPFDKERCLKSPNSYDLHLAGQFKLLKRTTLVIDPLEPQEYDTHEIGEQGETFWPGECYLCSTTERIETKGYVPWFDGRSSIGRLALVVHKTAGRGDDGFAGNITLEIEPTYPIKMRAGMLIAQVTFMSLVGKRAPYTGRYQNQEGPTESRYRDKE